MRSFSHKYLQQPQPCYYTTAYSASAVRACLWGSPVGEDTKTLDFVPVVFSQSRRKDHDALVRERGGGRCPGRHLFRLHAERGPFFLSSDVDIVGPGPQEEPRVLGIAAAAEHGHFGAENSARDGHEGGRGVEAKTARTGRSNSAGSPSLSLVSSVGVRHYLFL